MRSTVTSSASALNESVWAKLFGISLADGMRFSVGELFPGDKFPVFDTLPVLAPGTGTSVAPAPTAGTASTAAAPTDGYYDLQWHFDYLGDIEKIWEEFSGAGVHVGVYDDGLQYTHPDLTANYEGIEVLVDGAPIDPLQATLLGAPHGTAVAGLIAAANNGEGTIGVAWGASLTGVNIFSGPGDINNYYAGFLQAVAQSDKFDVINHSWGKYPGFWQDGVTVAMDQSLTDLWFAALGSALNQFFDFHANSDSSSAPSELGSCRTDFG